jgi:hypothetical protein
MRGPRAVTAALLIVIAVVGCRATLTGDDLHLCNAARLLSASVAITEETIQVGIDLRPEQGVERGVQALGLAESASRELHEVGGEEQAAAAWQSLIRAYKHAAEAAGTLLPDFQEVGVSGPESLFAARNALDEARVEVPASCFTLSAR